MNTSSRITKRFNRFITHITPLEKKLNAAERQATSLREQLTRQINDNRMFYIEKTFLAGSAAKHTNIISTGKGTFDIDIGIYFRAQGQPQEQLNRLLPYTHAQVRKLYPEKADVDFHQGKNAAHVTFRKSKLKIDVVPIIRADHPTIENSGYIPRQDELRLTSITAHVKFVHTRTAYSNQVPGPVTFNNLVRLMKWWNRRLPESLVQCSYFCELITAAALENSRVTATWQSSLDLIFSFLSEHAFAKPVIFGDYYDRRSVPRPADMVIVLDAVNCKNNVTRKWRDNTRQGYLNCVRQTHKHIKLARTHEQAGREEDALQEWCQVFGQDFLRLSR